MKTSNKLLLGFLGLLVLIMIFTALQLKAEYTKINLKDKFRNYDRIALNEVKFLVIHGSISNKNHSVDEFFVNCIQGNEKSLLLPRDTFFRNHITYKQSGDTLIIRSTLPYAYGLNIFLSGVNPKKIQANTAGILLDGLKIDHLQIDLEKSAAVTIARTQIEDCAVNITDKACVRLIKNSVVPHLDMNLQKQSEIELGFIKLSKVSLQMSSSAKIAATKENLLLLQKSGSLQ